MAYVTRSFSVETGHIYSWIDVSLKSEYQVFTSFITHVKHIQITKNRPS